MLRKIRILVFLARRRREKISLLDYVLSVFPFRNHILGSKEAQNFLACGGPDYTSQLKSRISQDPALEIKGGVYWTGGVYCRYTP